MGAEPLSAASDTYRPRPASGLLDRLRGLRGLWPVAALLALIAIVDQMLYFSLSRETPSQLHERFAEKAPQLTGDGPVLLILGSSRAQDGLPESSLKQALTESGLPHIPVNLAIGGGGTPSLLYAALHDRTTALERLPAGSKVVYVFSRFELNFLRPRLLSEFTAGKDLLERFGLVNSGHWVNRLHRISGIARFAYERRWNEWPWVARRVLEDSSSPIDLEYHPNRCNMAGLTNYRVLPVNAYALERLATAFGKSFIMVGPPVGDDQRVLDETYRLREKSAPYLDELAARKGVQLLDDFSKGLTLTPSAFDSNCDHLTDPRDKLAFSRAIVGLLK